MRRDITKDLETVEVVNLEGRELLKFSAGLFHITVMQSAAMHPPTMKHGSALNESLGPSPQTILVSLTSTLPRKGIHRSRLPALTAALNDGFNIFFRAELRPGIAAPARTYHVNHASCIETFDTGGKTPKCVWMRPDGVVAKPGAVLYLSGEAGRKNTQPANI